MVKEVNGKELKELIESGKTIVCDFWAGWCGPCRMLAPVMDSLSEEYMERAEFVKLDIDANPETAIEFEIMSIPTVIIFENGEIKHKNLGYMPEEIMREYLKENL